MIYCQLSKIDNRFENLKKYKSFLNCYFNTNDVQTSFEELVLNQKTDFSRYNFFYAKYLESSKQKQKPKELSRSL